MNTLKLTKTYNIQSHKKIHSTSISSPYTWGETSQPIFQPRSEVEISCPKDTLSGIYNCLNLRRGWGRNPVRLNSIFFEILVGCEVKGFGEGFFVGTLAFHVLDPTCCWILRGMAWLQLLCHWCRTSDLFSFNLERMRLRREPTWGHTIGPGLAGWAVGWRYTS